VAQELGIRRKRLYVWKNRHAELSEAGYGADNVLVSSGIYNPSTSAANFFLYGFATTGTGSATPRVQITGPDETSNSRFAIH